MQGAYSYKVTAAPLEFDGTVVLANDTVVKVKLSFDGTSDTSDVMRVLAFVMAELAKRP